MSESARKTRFGGVGRPVRLTGDRALANRVSGGDPAAVDEMFRRYHQPIYRFCSAMVGPEEAKDVLQDVMTKAMTSLPANEDLQMKPWLYRVARNECIDHIHGAGRAGPELDPDSRPDDSRRSDPYRAAVERERLRWLIDDLNELPEKQRAALIMRELSGLSFTEIAVGVGTSGAGAKQLVYEARLSLEQAELGRKLDCDEVRRSISSCDRRRLRGRKVRSHLRSCRGCSDFERAISDRQAGFRSLYPALPLGAALGLMKAIQGGGVVSGMAGSGSGATGGALAGGTATGVVAKGAVALLVAGGIGAGAVGVVRHHQEQGPSVDRSATAPFVKHTREAEATVSGAGDAGKMVPVGNPGAKDGLYRREKVDRRPGAAVPDREVADRQSSNGQQGDGNSTGERITPGNGAGQGPAGLPDSSAKGQDRAQEASSAKPGQTGAAPPSRKPVAPPGESLAPESGGNRGEPTTTNQAKPDSAPAVGQTKSPGKSGK